MTTHAKQQLNQNLEDANAVGRHSNLKGASAFMPVGVTPHEEELALIESLARDQSSKNIEPFAPAASI